MPTSDKKRKLQRYLNKTPALEAALQAPKPRLKLSHPFFEPGIPRGAITQISGPGSTEALLALLRGHPELKAAWVERRLSAYPEGLVERGVDLGQILFVEAGEAWAWALTQLLLSKIFGVVALASRPRAKDVGLELRRLQIAAERSGAALLLLGPQEGPAWALKLSLEASLRDGRLSLRERSVEAAREALG